MVRLVNTNKLLLNKGFLFSWMTTRCCGDIIAAGCFVSFTRQPVCTIKLKLQVEKSFWKTLDSGTFLFSLS